MDLGLAEVPFRPGCIANRKRSLENAHLAYFRSKTNAINTLTDLKKKKTEMEIELLKLTWRKLMLEIFNSENSLHKYVPYFLLCSVEHELQVITVSIYFITLSSFILHSCGYVFQRSIPQLVLDTPILNLTEYEGNDTTTSYAEVIH